MTEAAAPAPETGATDNGGQAAAAPANASWYNGFDADTQSFVTAKGWDKLDASAALGEAVKGYQSAERFIGVPATQLVRLPTDINDAEGWGKVYDRLGRPANAEQYDIPVPTAEEGGNPEFAAWAKGAFHQAGLSGTQAQNVTKAWNEYAKSMTAQMEKQWTDSMAADEVALQQEWGSAHGHHINVAMQAQAKLGITPEVANQLARVIGLKQWTNTMYNVGKAIAEPEMVSSDTSGAISGKFSPAEAQAKINERFNDPEFIAKVSRGDKAAMDEWNALNAALIIG